MPMERRGQGNAGLLCKPDGLVKVVNVLDAVDSKKYIVSKAGKS